MIRIEQAPVHLPLPRVRDVEPRARLARGGDARHHHDGRDHRHLNAGSYLRLIDFVCHSTLGLREERERTPLRVSICKRMIDPGLVGSLGGVPREQTSNKEEEEPRFGFRVQSIGFGRDPVHEGGEDVDVGVERRVPRVSFERFRV